MRISKCIFPLMTWRFTPFLLLWLFYSPVASAVDYYWSFSDSSLRFSSPLEACENHSNANLYAGGNKPVVLNRVTDISWNCQISGIYGGSFTIIINRSGDSCPEGSTYNSATGKCDQDCSSSVGEQLAARGPLSPVITDGDGFRTIAPEPFTSACFTGCSYEIQSSFSDRLSCALTSGSTTEGFCNYRVTGTGESCPASTGVPASGGDPLNPPPPEDPEDPPVDPGCPPPFVWTGDFCSVDPGDGGPPGDGDGDGSGDDGDTGGGGGPGGGSDGGGDGDGDNGGGDGDTGGGGDDSGGGDSPGACDPETDPSCAPSSVVGEACTADITCTGDAIACAILRQQKAQKCADEQFRDLSEPRVNEMQASINNQFSGEQYQPLEATPENTFDFSTMIDTSSQFSGSCPVISDINFNFGQQVVSIPIGQIMTMICPYLGWLGYLVVAFGMRRGAEIIAQGM